MTQWKFLLLVKTTSGGYLPHPLHGPLEWIEILRLIRGLRNLRCYRAPGAFQVVGVKYAKVPKSPTHLDFWVT